MTALNNNWGTEYKVIPPDGGWGYFIVAGATVITVCNIIPMAGFGIVFGPFLADMGDETTGTTLANGIFNTVMSFTGLLANVLLKKYSCRTVGLVGALIFSTGAFGIIFAHNLLEFVVYFGAIQGLGMGLMFPASCTALNSYFDKKMNLMMSISQSIMVAVSMVAPLTEAFLMDHYGFRATVALIAAFSLFNIPATAVMQPVTKHMKKVPLQKLLNAVVDEEIGVDQQERSKSLTTDILTYQIQPILYPKLETIKSMSQTNVDKDYNLARSRSILMSFGDRAVSVQTIGPYQKDSQSKNVEESTKKGKPLMDLSLLKDPVYMNIAAGLSLSFTSDVAFISIIPLVLNSLDFTSEQVALMLLVFFGADFISRILLSVASAFLNIRNRYLVWYGTLFTALTRLAFLSNDSFTWKIATLGAMGFFRCLIQTPIPLVISDEYSNDFSTAFSLYMVVCGVVSLIFGVLMSVVKHTSGSDIMVCHLLTAALLLCVLSWLVEYLLTRKRTRQVIK